MLCFSCPVLFLRLCIYSTKMRAYSLKRTIPQCHSLQCICQCSSHFVAIVTTDSIKWNTVILFFSPSQGYIYAPASLHFSHINGKYVMPVIVVQKDNYFCSIYSLIQTQLITLVMLTVSQTFRIM